MYRQVLLNMVDESNDHPAVFFKNLSIVPIVHNTITSLGDTIRTIAIND